MNQDRRDRDRLEARFREMFRFLFPEEEGPAAAIRQILDPLDFRVLEAGTVLLREGEVCQAVPFVLEGAIRVFKTSESGREITLYRIEAGQSCILGSGCSAGDTAFPARVVAESRTEAAFMPAMLVRRLLETSVPFRDFVLAQYSRRLAGIIELVEEVAFRHVDQRLKEFLSQLASERRSGRLVVTHQELADHLGSSREVVSRILKDWEQRAALELGRGEIRLLASFDALAV